MNLTLVTISLITARAHQIRVQFSHEGYPLAGDSKYGRKSDYLLALFAYQLLFTHPVTQKKITITAPLPDGRPWNLFSRYPSLSMNDFAVRVFRLRPQQNSPKISS